MRHFVLLMIVSITLLLSDSIAFADSPAPQKDYIIEVGDGQYEFVMLSIPEDQSAFGQGGAIQDAEIRAKYSQSGLYRVGDTSEAIWTIDWYAFDVDISFDGQYLIRWGPWAFAGNYSEIALEFYGSGELLKSYRVCDLVAEPEKLPRTMSHYTWKGASEFHETTMKLFLRTMNDEQYWFDATTGSLTRGTIVECPTVVAEVTNDTQTKDASNAIPPQQGNGGESIQEDSGMFKCLLVGALLVIAWVAMGLIIRRINDPSKNTP